MHLEGGPGLELCPLVSDEYILTYLQLTYYQGYQDICMPSFWGEG